MENYFITVYNRGDLLNVELPEGGIVALVNSMMGDFETYNSESLNILKKSLMEHDLRQDLESPVCNARDDKIC